MLVRHGFTLVLVFLVSVVSFSQEEDRSSYPALFDKAAQEFNVPPDVLKGIAFAETRWSQLTWAAGDTASPCNGMPRPYGLMSLWDNNYFGHSLLAAASLIGKDPAELKNDVFQNIRGAAALLRKGYDALPRPEGTGEGDIESWRNAIAAYSGLPQAELSQQHALDIYTQMTRGYHQYGIAWDARQVALAPIRTAVAKIQAEAEAKRSEILQKPTDMPDYPLAKWAQAASGHWYTTGVGDYFVVIHDMEGYYLSTISYFQNPATQASAHFCINGLKNGPGENNTGDAPAGEITQMVELKNWAWHVVCWNKYMIGIEHEGFVNTPAWYTNEMYTSSAQLTKWLCDRFGIPKDRNHIIAHGEWQNATWKSWMATNFSGIDVTCNTHTDPGQYWNWSLYMSLVTSDTLAPRVLAVSPAPNATAVPAYKDVTVSFSSSMDLISANSAFSITPTVAGAISWNSDSKTLTFHPTNLFAFNTSYTVKVQGTAKSVGSGKGLDGNGDGVSGDAYQFSFATAPLDTLGAVVYQSYPAQGENTVSLFADVKVTLNEPITQASLAARVFIVDSIGTNISYNNGKYETIGDRGVISFSPKLQRNKLYKVKLLAGLKDLYGIDSKSDIIVQFRSAQDTVLDGTIVDNFETNTGGWQQPISVSGTALVDSLQTAFAISSEKKKSGSYSGKLSYGFTQATGGTAVLKPTSSAALDAASSFGLWVYGDNGNNTLTAAFDPGSQTIALGSINWYGWKFLSIASSQLTGSGRKLNSLLLGQASGAALQGVLYFDDWQLDPTVVLNVRGEGVMPGQYVLEQNFPNPFNPQTHFRFTIADSRFVQLQIFDVLGRNVATLVNEQMPAGHYEVPWDATNISSGVYFYQLSAGNFLETKKLTILK